jgi:antitoxin FitA
LTALQGIDSVDIESDKEISMSAITVRSLPEATHRALKLRAAQNGRSTEAEIRAILEAAVQPKILLGSALRAVGQSIGGITLSVKRDRTAVARAKFE